VDVAIRFIDEDDVDITITSSPLPQHGLLNIPFLKDEWVVVANRELAAQMANIPFDQHHQCIGLVCLEQSLTNDAVAPIFRGQLANFKKRAIYDDLRLLLDSALRGHGIACMPRLLATDALECGDLVVLPDYQRFPDATWWLSRTDEPRSPIVVEVFNWLLSHSENQKISA
jgi:LysR family glycine cleavage system transcriptional activator